MFPAIVNSLVMLGQFINAQSPIEVTVSGIFIVPNDVQLVNACVAIDRRLPPSAIAGIL